MQTGLGFTHFLAQTDAIARAVLAVLALMSIINWYLILAKGARTILMARRSRRFLASFDMAQDAGAVRRLVDEVRHAEPFAALTAHAFAAIDQYARRGTDTPIAPAASDDFVAQSMRRSIAQSSASLESGLAVLASIGSSAPFIGLFGTVWGIYNALLAIGMSGQGTLDKVAGPVGEALIMTAIGLAVAIPAVLGYNAFVRANRSTLTALDRFGHDLHAFLSTGVRRPAHGELWGSRASARPPVPATGS